MEQGSRKEEPNPRLSFCFVALFLFLLFLVFFFLFFYVLFFLARRHVGS